jgi:glycosyltransferase involved in cell wall biosynthesis
MKILQLATSIEGGAGKAALRSHHALIQAGLDSTLMYLHGKQTDAEQHQIKYTRSNWDNFHSRARTLLQSKIVQVSDELITTFSLDLIHKNPEILNLFDIVHIHSMYNFVNERTLNLLVESNVGVVITMHDMRLATGGCHYSGTCEGYKTSCSDCPLVRPGFRKSVSKSKLRQGTALSKFDNLTIVAPSMWLKDKVSDLPEFNGTQVITVNNPVPEIYFSPRKARTSSTFKIGFISANLNNPYKGLNILVKAVNKLATNSHSELELVFMGKGKILDIDPRIKWSTRSSSKDEEVKDFYDEIDLLCVPSIEDNSPSVISEAIAGGVSVVGSRVGGIPELLELFDMRVVEPGDSNSLANAIAASLNSSRNMSKESLALQKFSFESYARTLSKIYTEKRASI